MSSSASTSNCANKDISQPLSTDQISTDQSESMRNHAANSQNGNVLLAITGGIAAYKSAILARLLVKAGYTVQVIMTKGAQEFITPLTLQALTGHAVHTELLDETAEAGMGHIELAKWADLLIIAPASANTMARLSAGMADDLLTTVCLASSAPVLVAPAMNQQMWAHAAVQRNMTTLNELGYHVIEPASGEQACGDVGSGRLPEPEALFDTIQRFVSNQVWQLSNHKTANQDSSLTSLYSANLSSNNVSIQTQALKGKKVTITAGPTVEAIDPVRYLSNHSTGKMGFAIAKACQNAGAKVTLIAGGKITLETPESVQRVDVLSASDMLKAADQSAKLGCDIFIATAAVADYRTKEAAPQKIKKTQDTMVLELVKNPDILATISHDYPDIFMVGFAAETQNVEKYAKGKLKAKNLDMIACNDVSRKDIGFASNDNAVTVYFADKYAHNTEVLDKASKDDIAEQLVKLIADTV